MPVTGNSRQLESTNRSLTTLMKPWYSELAAAGPGAGAGAGADWEVHMPKKPKPTNKVEILMATLCNNRSAVTRSLQSRAARCGQWAPIGVRDARAGRNVHSRLCKSVRQSAVQALTWAFISRQRGRLMQCNSSSLYDNLSNKKSSYQYLYDICGYNSKIKGPHLSIKNMRSGRWNAREGVPAGVQSGFWQSSNRVLRSCGLIASKSVPTGRDCQFNQLLTESESCEQGGLLGRRNSGLGHMHHRLRQAYFIFVLI